MLSSLWKSSSTAWDVVLSSLHCTMGTQPRYLRRARVSMYRHVVFSCG